MDPTAQGIPISMGGSALAAKPSSVAIGCQSELDGETQVFLGWQHEVDPGTTPMYVGRLAIPTGSVSVRTVLNQEALSLPVPRKSVTVRVWTNHPTEPSEVRIGIS